MNQPFSVQPSQPSSGQQKQPSPGAGQSAAVHTMPNKFLQTGQAPKKSPSLSLKPKKLFLILGIVFIALLAVGAGAYVLLQQASKNPPTNQNTNAIANTNTAGTNANSVTNQNANASNANTTSGDVIQAQYTDPKTNEVQNTAVLTIPTLAIPGNATAVTMTPFSSALGAYAGGKLYQPVSAVFLISPQNTTLTQKATLSITYSTEGLLALDFVAKEEQLQIAYWNGSDWTPIVSTATPSTKTVTADIMQLFGDGMAVVATKPASSTNTNANTNSITPPTITPSADTDNDGLTDIEEELYKSLPNNVDSDSDTYHDGQEVLSHYNPNGKNTLLAANLIKTYANTTYHYSILYPTTWTVGTLSEDKSVLFTSATGEFVQVSVQANATHVSAREWYLSLNPSVGQSSMRDVTVGTLTGIIGPDNLNVYLADANYIYQITYNIGVKTAVNFLTTYTMMYTSFLITGSTAPTNSNTNSSVADRDNRRISDVRETQSALELYYNDQVIPGYPGAGTSTVLSSKILGSTYLATIPVSPTPNDGACSATNNNYYYLGYADKSTASATCTGSTTACGWYKMSFCLGSATGGLTAGVHSATPAGIQ